MCDLCCVLYTQTTAQYLPLRLQNINCFAEEFDRTWPDQWGSKLPCTFKAGLAAWGRFVATSRHSHIKIYVQRPGTSFLLDLKNISHPDHPRSGHWEPYVPWITGHLAFLQDTCEDQPTAPPLVVLNADLKRPHWRVDLLDIATGKGLGCVSDLKEQWHWATCASPPRVAATSRLIAVSCPDSVVRVFGRNDHGGGGWGLSHVVWAEIEIEETLVSSGGVRFVNGGRAMLVTYPGSGRIIKYHAITGAVLQDWFFSDFVPVDAEAMDDEANVLLVVDASRGSSMVFVDNSGCKTPALAHYAVGYGCAPARQTHALARAGHRVYSADTETTKYEKPYREVVAVAWFGVLKMIFAEHDAMQTMSEARVFWMSAVFRAPKSSI